MPSNYFLITNRQYFVITNGTIAERSTPDGWVPASKFPTFIHSISYQELPEHLKMELSLLDDLLKTVITNLGHPDANQVATILTAYIEGTRYIGDTSTELLALNIATKIYFPRLALAG